MPFFLAKNGKEDLLVLTDLVEAGKGQAGHRPNLSPQPRRLKRCATWRRATRGRRSSSPSDLASDPGDRVVDYRRAAWLVVRLVMEPRIHATRHVRASLERPAGPLGHDRVVRAVQNVRRDRQRPAILERLLDAALLAEEGDAKTRRSPMNGERVREVGSLDR